MADTTGTAACSDRKASCSWRDVLRFVNDDALHVVERLIGGGDVFNSVPAGDREIERVVGQEAVLFLKFKGNQHVLRMPFGDKEGAVEQVAHALGVGAQLTDQLGPLGQRAGRIRT